MKLTITFGFTREFNIPDEIKNNPSDVLDFIRQNFEEAEKNKKIIRYIITDVSNTDEFEELIDAEI